MSNPIVTVQNHSHHDIFVDGDPNWDDQVLKINGESVDSTYTLTPGATIKVSVDWDSAGSEEMMGVIFADAKDYDAGGVGFYQLSIGQDVDTGKLAVTDPFINGEPHEKYKLKDQAAWSMTMDFVDAPRR
jgi:hypothetical protein